MIVLLATSESNSDIPPAGQSGDQPTGQPGDPKKPSIYF